MKYNHFFLILIFLIFSFTINGQSGDGHDPDLVLSYTPTGYSVSTTMRQDAGYTTFAKNDINNNGGNTDLFVNFTFDTSGMSVFAVYTTNGSVPTKSNGTSVSGSFSNYAEPNRTWVVSIPNTANTAGTTIEYVFYISNSDLASGFGRVTPGGGYQTSWGEGDQIGFRYKVFESNVAAGGNWSNTTTWNSGTVPNSATTPVEIIGTNTVTLDQNAETQHLNLITGSSLDIAETNGLTVNGELFNNGAITLQSTSATYASLIPTTVSGTGTYEYQRFTARVGPTGTNDLVSPPVLQEGASNRFDNFASLNSSILAQDPLDSDIKAYAPFDNNSGSYSNYDTFFDDDVPLFHGKGYRAGTVSGQNIKYGGKVIATGNIGLTGFGIGTDVTYGIWNLIGNPYTSYITLAGFLSQNSGKFDGSSAGIYGYNGSNWTIWNQSYSDANPGTLIAPGQGFFISSNGTDTSGDLFTTTMRSTGSSDDFIAGRTVQTSFGHVKIKAESTSNDYSTDLYFNSNATRGLDPGYDASLFGGTAPDFSIYSHLVEDNQGVPMGIQALGATDFSDVNVPLGIHVAQGEQVTVSMTENTVPANINVYLEDNVENTFTLLNTGTYVFTPSSTLNTTGRFFLRFSDSALSSEDYAFNGISIYGLTTLKQIKIDGVLNQETQFIVYDIQGRAVMTKSLEMNTNTQRIDASSLVAGIYVVELKSKDQRITSKVILK